MSSEESLSVAALAASGDTSNANPGDDFQQEPTEATTESPAPATAAATESPFMEPSKDAGTTSPPPPVKAAAGEPPNSPRGTQAAEALAKIWKKDADDDQPQTFPQVLMEILCNDEHNDIISWLPHGRSFIIYKKKKFANSILPNYFKATKFTSFTRKLNRWGFTRVTRGPEMGSYYHKLFLRDDPQLCLRMSSHSNNKFQEPNSILPNAMVAPGMPFMPYGMMPPVLPPGMTQVDVSQQSQLINQQLQQLQWQQYQLQQYQHQQQHHNHATGPPPADGSPIKGGGPPGAPSPASAPGAAAPSTAVPAWGAPMGMMPPGGPPPPPPPAVMSQQQQKPPPPSGRGGGKSTGPPGQAPIPGAMPPQSIQQQQLQPPGDVTI